MGMPMLVRDGLSYSPFTSKQEVLLAHSHLAGLSLPHHQFPFSPLSFPPPPFPRSRHGRHRRQPVDLAGAGAVGRCTSRHGPGRKPRDRGGGVGLAVRRKAHRGSERVSERETDVVNMS